MLSAFRAQNKLNNNNKISRHQLHFQKPKALDQNNKEQCWCLTLGLSATLISGMSDKGRPRSARRGVSFGNSHVEREPVENRTRWGHAPSCFVRVAANGRGTIPNSWVGRNMHEGIDQGSDQRRGVRATMNGLKLGQE